MTQWCGVKFKNSTPHHCVIVHSIEYKSKVPAVWKGLAGDANIEFVLAKIDPDGKNEWHHPDQDGTPISHSFGITMQTRVGEVGPVQNPSGKSQRLKARSVVSGADRRFSVVGGRFFGVLLEKSREIGR